MHLPGEFFRRLISTRNSLGRLAEVIDADGRLTRKNDVAFGDDGHAPNPSVSRAHAHIDFDPERAVSRLFDDWSAHGTTVIKGGSVIPVPQGPSKGVALRHGDEIVLGQASLRFEEAVPIPFRLANCFHSLGRSIEAVTKLTINPLPNPKRKSNAIGAKPEFLPRHYLSVSFCVR
jgi:hypothetical protein